MAGTGVASGWYVDNLRGEGVFAVANPEGGEQPISMPVIRKIKINFLMWIVLEL
jgi:hypothetical protein